MGSHRWCSSMHTSEPCRPSPATAPLVEWGDEILRYWEDFPHSRFVLVSSDNSVAKDLIAKLEVRYTSKRILLLNSESDDCIKSMAADKRMWKMSDCVAYTATVGCGLDIDLEVNCFSTCFVYGTPFTTPHELLQMSFRVRNVMDYRIHLKHMHFCYLRLTGRSWNCSEEGSIAGALGCQHDPWETVPSMGDDGILTYFWRVVNDKYLHFPG